MAAYAEKKTIRGITPGQHKLTLHFDESQWQRLWTYCKREYGADVRQVVRKAVAEFLANREPTVRVQKMD